MTGDSNPLTPILDFAIGLIVTSINSLDFYTADSCNSLSIILPLMHLFYNHPVLLRGILFEAPRRYNLITGDLTRQIILLSEVKNEDSVQHEETWLYSS